MVKKEQPVLTVKTATDTYIFNSEKERDAFLTKQEKKDSLEEAAYTDAIRGSKSAIDRQLQRWALACMQKLKKHGNGPENVQEILEQLHNLLQQNGIEDLSKSVVALDPESLFNKELQKIHKIFMDAATKKDDRYNYSYVNGTEQTAKDNFDENSAFGLWNNLQNYKVPYVEVEETSLSGVSGPTLSKRLEVCPSMKPIIMKEAIESMHLAADRLGSRGLIDDQSVCQSLFITGMFENRPEALEVLKTFFDEYVGYRDYFIQQMIQEANDMSGGFIATDESIASRMADLFSPLKMSDFKGKSEKEIHEAVIRSSFGIAALLPKEDDSYEVSVGKKVALEQLALKGYPMAQEKMVVLYAKEGDVKRAEAMAKRLSKNEFAQKENRAEALEAVDLLKKKNSKSSGLQEVFQNLGSINNRPTRQR